MVKELQIEESKTTMKSSLQGKTDGGDDFNDTNDGMPYEFVATPLKQSEDAPTASQSSEIIAPDLPL